MCLLVFVFFWDFLTVFQYQKKCLSIRHEFSRIFKALVVFLKNWFNSSDINWTSDIAVSSSSTRAILFVIFRFLKKKRLNSFPKCFIATYFWRIKITENLLAFFSKTICCNNFTISCNFLAIHATFLKNKSFVNLTFSYSLFLRIPLHMGHDLLLLPFYKEVSAYLKYLRKLFQKMHNLWHIFPKNLS